jgi:hypothetical protein
MPADILRNSGGKGRSAEKGREKGDRLLYLKSSLSPFSLFFLTFSLTHNVGFYIDIFPLAIMASLINTLRIRKQRRARSSVRVAPVTVYI